MYAPWMERANHEHILSNGFSTLIFSMCGRKRFDNTSFGDILSPKWRHARRKLNGWVTKSASFAHGTERSTSGVVLK